MLRTLCSIGALALIVSFAPRASGQALPTASARGTLQAGVGYSFATPDYGPQTLQGVTGFADFDLSRFYGVEFDAHIINLITPTDIAENTYLLGPRIMYPYRGRFILYGKGLIGFGNFKVLETQDNQGQYDGTYLAYSLGGGMDIRATNHIVIRAIDVEEQKWPNYGLHGLTPVVYTFGLAYHFR